MRLSVNLPPDLLHELFKRGDVAPGVAHVKPGRPDYHRESDARHVRHPAPGNVILLEGEDSLATTRRNLQTSGADLARVFAWDRSVQGTEKPLAFPDDIDFLADQIRERSAELVVIDPVAAFLRVNIHNDQAVRKALSPLSGLAEETGAAIVLVRHLTKSGDANPLYRGAGSAGLIAAWRTPSCWSLRYPVLRISGS